MALGSAKLLDVYRDVSSNHWHTKPQTDSSLFISNINSRSFSVLLVISNKPRELPAAIPPMLPYPMQDKEDRRGFSFETPVNVCQTVGPATFQSYSFCCRPFDSPPTTRFSYSPFAIAGSIERHRAGRGRGGRAALHRSTRARGRLRRRRESPNGRYGRGELSPSHRFDFRCKNLSSMPAFPSQPSIHPRTNHPVPLPRPPPRQ